MARQVMTRSKADNKYLHKDFHCSFNCAIEYLNDKYGAQSVREYLQRFTRAFYAPLIKHLKRRGLIALKEHFERIYEIEEGSADIKLDEHDLTIQVNVCPAVEHIRKSGMAVSPLFYETTNTVNETLCEGTQFTSELLNYNHQTGSSIQRFYRRDCPV